VQDGGVALDDAAVEASFDESGDPLEEASPPLLRQRPVI
jgi:hypothetical protein